MDCEGLYADVVFENSTSTENVKDKEVLDSLIQAYTSYKGTQVKNQIIEYSGSGWYYSLPAVYHPLQVVQIYFSTATYDEIVNDVSVSLGDQISAIGGTMGLFAGFSILSAVEVVYFILKSLFSLMSKSRMKI